MKLLSPFCSVSIPIGNQKKILNMGNSVSEKRPPTGDSLEKSTQFCQERTRRKEGRKQLISRLQLPFQRNCGGEACKETHPGLENRTGQKRSTTPESLFLPDCQWLRAAESCTAAPIRVRAATGGWSQRRAASVILSRITSNDSWAPQWKFTVGQIASSLSAVPVFPSPCSLCLLLSQMVVQVLSHVRFFGTPWTAARQASLSFTVSQSSLKLTSTESVMPPNHLILCRLLLLLTSIFSSIRVFSNELALRIRRPKYLGQSL